MYDNRKRSCNIFEYKNFFFILHCVKEYSSCALLILTSRRISLESKVEKYERNGRDGNGVERRTAKLV